MSKKDQTDVILEDINGKFDLVVGMFQDMKTNMVKKGDFEEIKADVKTIKAAVTDTNTQVADHEVRITELVTA